MGEKNFRSEKEKQFRNNLVAYALPLPMNMDMTKSPKRVTLYPKNFKFPHSNSAMASEFHDYEV